MSSGSKPNVVIVDDREEDIFAATCALEHLDVNFVTARSGEAALEKLEVTTNIALIILDRNMPGMSGIECARQLREISSLRDVPIVFLTGMDSGGGEAIEGYQAGAIDYLLKPVDPDVLEAKVSAFVSMYRHRARLQQQAAELEKRQIQLEQAHDKLVQSSKLAAIGELASGVAHELNNPLQIASMAVGLLRLRVDQDTQSDSYLISELHEKLESLESGITRCSSIVTNMLAFSRSATGAFVRLDLRGEILSVLELVQNQLNNMLIEVRVSLPDELPVVGNANNLQQVILNLVMNGAQAPESKKINIQGELLDSRVLLHVIDDGAGVPDDIRTSIFEPFFTTKPEGNGTGLGLAISQAIVTRHGGEIVLAPQSGSGTQFTVILPEVA